MQNNLKAELSILVSMMPDDELMNVGLAELTSDCFSTTETKNIFGAIKELHSQGRQATIDNVNFPIELYASAMQDGILDLKEFMNTCEELSNWHSCRELIAMSDMVKAMASSGNFKRAFEYNVTNIGKINSAKDYLSFVDWSVAAKNAEERIIKMGEPNGMENYYISSGNSEIDRVYTGFPVGLVIVAADSGEGKSTVVLPTILANKDRDIFVASTEVSAEGVSANIAAIEANIYRSDIHRAKIKDQELETYIQTLRSCIANLKGGVSMQRKLSRIIAEMKLWRAKTDKKKVGLAVIDFLTDIFDDYGNTYADDKLIRNAISILKGLSKELNVCMIVLCQFNTKREMRKDKRPKREDIYGSKSVYQSADVVLYPYRPIMWLPPKEKVYYEGKRFEDAFFIIDKFKENGLMDIPVVFDCFVTQFKCIQKKAMRTAFGETLMPVTASMLNAEFEASQRKAPF